MRERARQRTFKHIINLLSLLKMYLQFWTYQNIHRIQNKRRVKTNNKEGGRNGEFECKLRTSHFMTSRRKEVKGTKTIKIRFQWTDRTHQHTTPNYWLCILLWKNDDDIFRIHYIFNFLLTMTHDDEMTQKETRLAIFMNNGMGLKIFLYYFFVLFGGKNRK